MMRHKWRVYLQLFNDSGDYSGVWTEITDDVDFDKLGAIQADLDNTEYDIGVYRANNFSITLNNSKGKYSDIGYPNTIFRYRRPNTLVKVVWEITDEQAICGLCRTDECWLSEEKDIFFGLINDEASELDVHAQKVNFKVLGLESIFQKVVVPFGSISAGDLVSEVLYECLNQTAVTDLLTVSQANITVGLDQAIDSISELQNKTVQEGLNTLLLVSNSVVYIDRDRNLIISPRTATAAVQKTFYGQASPDGSENIISIQKFKSGIARTFNFFTFEGTTLYAEDASSRTNYGTRKKEIGSDNFTDNTKRQLILNALRTEFGQPKQELSLTTFWDYRTESLDLLDRVAIDYPTVYLDTGEELPICGQAICGSAVLPKSLWDFTMTTETNWKILGRSIDTKMGLVTFKLREI